MAAIYSCFILQANQSVRKQEEELLLKNQEYFEIRMFNY